MASKEVARMCHSNTRIAQAARIVDNGNRLQEMIERAGDMLWRGASTFIVDIGESKASAGDVVNTWWVYRSGMLPRRKKGYNRAP